MAVTNLDLIKAALDFIPVSDRDSWLRAAMGLKSELGEDGFALWDRWSQQDESYDPHSAKSVWRSVKGAGGVTIGSIFSLARANGWCDDSAYRSPTPEEIERRRVEAANRSAAEKSSAQRERDNTARLARRVWSISEPVQTSNPYMQRKAIEPIGSLRELDADQAAAKLGYRPRHNGEALRGHLLIVPIAIDDQLSTLEFIDGDGRKAALAGRGTKSGGYWSTGPLSALPEDASTILVGEGVATVISAARASGALGVAAFSDSNLMAVAQTIRRRLPAAQLTILADLEKASSAPNRKAIAAAKATRAKLAAPLFSDPRPPNAKDFNDMAKLLGESAVASRVRDAVEVGEDPRPKEPSAEKPSVELVKASDVQPEPVTWLWKDYVPAGKLTLLAGAPGTGKTTIAMALAATISNGGAWPDGTRSLLGTVVVWSGEDAIADTLVPRLLSAGADRDRVHFVHGVVERAQRRPFDPAKDLDPLKHALSGLHNVRLLIVDPIVSAIAGDSHKNAETRRGLQPLSELGKELGCAILGITHFSKGTAGRDPVERLTGSVAFGAVARVVLIAAKENGVEQQQGETKRILVRAKSNIGPDGGGFNYTLEYAPLTGDPGIVASRVSWNSPISGTARELLAKAETIVDRGNATELDAATRFLTELLGAGPVDSRQIRSDSKDAGHSWATVRRAQTLLGVKPRKSGMKGAWVWELPGRCSSGSEPAQPNGMSIFDDLEHLRTGDNSGADPYETH